MKKSYFAVLACVVSALISSLGCSAQVTEEEHLGTAGAAGGSTTPPTNPTITTGMVPPTHSVGQVIVTDENSGTIVPDPALAGVQNIVVLQFAVDSLGNDARVVNHEFVLIAEDGGSVVSFGGYPYFDGFRLIDFDTGAFIGNGTMHVASPTELDVRFTGEELFVAEGTKRFVGLMANIAEMPPKPEEQQFLDRTYRVAKTPYVEGDILDQNELVISADEVTEDAPMLGDPLVITAGT